MGTLFPALPRAADAFFVLAYEPERFLVLGVHPDDKEPVVTWAFVLQEIGPNQTRLITRARASAGYEFHRLPFVFVKIIHYIMQRKQLLEIARSAETTTAIVSDWPAAS